MKRVFGALTALVALSLICLAGAPAAEQNPTDVLALRDVEVVFHQAASTKDVDLMMSLFADDATLAVGGKTYAGKEQVRHYFATVAGPFQPQNNWVAYTPTQRMRIETNGNEAHLYFECLYIDVVGKQIATHTFSDDQLVRSGDKWLIKFMKAGLVPEL